MRALLLCAVVACGSNPATPDAANPDAAAGEPFQPACSQTADLPPVLPGTLRHWDPDGRWFYTGTAMGGVSSVKLHRNGDQIIVDDNEQEPGTIDDTQVMQTGTVRGQLGQLLAVTVRIANLMTDGSLRADRIVCDGPTCSLCTAKLVRATHNADEGEGDHITLVGELRDPLWGPGYTFNVRVAGTLAFLIRQDGLHIIETADPAHPVQVGFYRRTDAGYSNDIKLVDAGARRYALIADIGVDVVDVTNPAAPMLAGQISQSAHTLFTETRGATTLAFLGNYNGTCPVYDVTNPAAPVKLGVYDAGSSLLHDLSIKDGIGYLNAWEKGLHVVDFTVPGSPRLLGTWAPTPTRTSHSNWTTTAGGRHIALHGEEAYAANLDIVDVDPASATFMQPFATWKTRDWISIHNIMAFGTKAYFTYYQDGVRVLDLSDPAHPRQVGYYNTWDPQASYTTSAFFEGAVGIDVDPARKLIFVADSPRGLMILRDDTP